ncbi:regucalcin-like [Macrosteles quadrilineatus]|uniref:regucalcin-like n=1 Tax=Macrosteles quadrilineatus TaxID=74068 RepID=UPI0023E099F4|nr:regucalcin-like [Macrosteles quadrilineatus]
MQDGPVLTRVTEPVDHGEGPHWDPTEKVLYYVDISGQALHRYDPAIKTDISLKFDKPVALVVPMRGQRQTCSSGGAYERTEVKVYKPVALVVPMRGQRYKFVAGLGRDLVMLTWEWDTGVHYHTTINTVDQHEPMNRLNDGKADANGRMWAGTIGFEKPVGSVLPDRGTLYRLDNDPSKPCVADVEIRPVTISNGLTWSLDNKILYYIDTPTRRVDAFDYDLENGTLSHRRTVFSLGAVTGNPDGMTIDADGNLWIACWGGSQIIRVDPKTGALLRMIKIPVTRVTSVTWGGPMLDTLYVTTMRLGLSDSQLVDEPHAGAVWEVRNLKAIGTAQHTAVVTCKCNTTLPSTSTLP